MPYRFSETDKQKIVERVLHGEKVTKVCKEENISRVLFYRWLKNYKTTHKTVPQKLSSANRLQMIQRVKLGEPVAKVCKLYGVSRTVFYRWLKRYNDAPENKKNEALWDKTPFVSRYFNQAPEQYEGAVLSAVRQYPEMSSHKLVWVLPQIGGQPILGNHGVQNVLRRHNLSTYEQRYDYAKAYNRPTPASQFFGLFNSILAVLTSQTPALRKFIVRASFAVTFGIFIGIVIFGVNSLSSLLSSFSNVTISIGIIFSLFALGAGMLFFIYSIKYYLNIAVVLSFSRRSGDEDKRNSGGLKSDLSSVRLERHPFVSIHIATYNEKRVVERLLTSITSMQYDNYEVIIADDSNDETTAIIQKFSEQWNTTNTTNTTNKPIIKHIHRSTREGFKGGALKGALEHTNPKAEYILIFDADFIPYPDTIVQFLKYFQATASPVISTSLSSQSHGLNSFQDLDSSRTEMLKQVQHDKESNIAAIQGYQWHVLNKSENWITRGVRSEYSGSYVIERSGEEIYSGLKQISGSVYMIRRDVLSSIGWGTSITEDFQLTLKLYEKGYKVVYTPYIQSPAEGVSTIKRLIRQRMRWAEGHSHNIRKMFGRLMFGRWIDVNPNIEYRNSKQYQNTNYQNTKQFENSDLGHSNLFRASDFGFRASKQGKKFIPSPLTLPEKLEFLYLSPYYLQAAFFILGTLSWFIAEVIFKVRLPFWTEVWGWSLVFTNLLALPLLNMVGLFMEEADEKDYLGILSFIALSYIVAPFQGYAAIKGFIAKQEGPWFRTPKTGRITDTFMPGRLYRFVRGIFGRPQTASSATLTTTNSPRIATNLAFVSAYNSFSNFRIRRRHVRWMGNLTISLFLIITVLLTSFARFIPITSQASASGRSFKSLKQVKDMKIPTPPQNNEITNPEIVRYQLQDDKALEYIFHKDPRVRVKLVNKEVEMKLVGFDGHTSINNSRGFKNGNIYTYQNILPEADLRYTIKGTRLEEELILNRYRDIKSIDEEVKITGLVMAKIGDQIAIADTGGGNPIMTFTKPFMYEINHPEVRHEGLKYEIEKTTFGYKVRKVLTTDGKQWLSDPKRHFPISIDPTMVQSSPTTASVTEAETDYGSFQRKIAYSDNSSAWYAFDGDGGNIAYKKCSASSLCDEDLDWGSTVAVSADGSNQANPSVWFQRAGTGDGMIFVAWIDDSTTTEDVADSVAFETINTASSDAQGGQCNSDDQGAFTEQTRIAYIAVGNNGDALVGYHQGSGTLDTEADIFEVPNGTTCGTTGGDFPTDAGASIETGSGLPTGSQLVAVVPFEVATNRIVIIYNDAGENADLRESQFNISNSTWNFSDNDVDGANSLNRLIFSAVSDGTDIWVLRADSATALDFFRCSGCTGDSAHTWTTTDALPFTGLTLANLSEVSLSYVATSPSNTLVAMFFTDDVSTEQAYLAGTDADTISWSTHTSFNFTAGDLGNLTSTFYTANDTEVGVLVRETAALSFSTLPEYSMLLLFILPLFYNYIIRLRKRKYYKYYAKRNLYSIH